MSPSPHLPTLPPEIILHIVDSLIPTGKVPIALPAYDPITKALLALTRTSKLTYVTALRLLYRRCLHIDSYKRLFGVLAALQTHDPTTPRQQRDPLRARGSRPDLSLYIPLLDHITSLYLTRSPDSYTDYPSSVRGVCKLLDLVAPRLKHLLLSFPIYHDVRNDKIFRMFITSLSKLASLEVFSICKDVLGRDRTQQPPNLESNLPWSHWPKLRVLALHRSSPLSEDWKFLTEIPQLERLVISNSRYCSRPLWRSDELKSGKRGGPLEVVYISQKHFALGEKLKTNSLLKIAEVLVEGSYAGKNSSEDTACDILATGEEMGAAWVAKRSGRVLNFENHSAFEHDGLMDS